MPLRIVLHAGFHKTGTSSMQQALRANRALLRPWMRVLLKPGMDDLLRAARGYSTDRDADRLEKVRLRFAELLSSQPRMPRRTLCLSAEELAGHMPGRPAVPDYSAAIDLASVYAELCAARFPGVPVCFALSTRDADDWLTSAYWEHVKSSAMSLSLEDFRIRFRTAADLDGIADGIRRATGAEVVRMPLRHDADPAAPLLALCGVPPGTARAPAAVVNARLPGQVLLDLLEANRNYPDTAQRQAAKAEILARHRQSRNAKADP